MAAVAAAVAAVMAVGTDVEMQHISGNMHVKSLHTFVYGRMNIYWRITAMAAYTHTLMMHARIPCSSGNLIP